MSERTLDAGISDLHTPVTMERMVKHLNRFGPEGIMEIAVFHLDFDQLLELQALADEKTPKLKHRKSVHTRVELLCGIPEEAH